MKGVNFQWVKIPPGKGSLQPVAIGASVEVMKPMKPSVEKDHYGGSANTQAVTRVNVEQASKRAMREPIWLSNREGRRCW